MNLLNGRRLTVVMYHYVRPEPGPGEPRLIGLTPAVFEGQLDYIARHYEVVSLREVFAAQAGGDPLPERPCLLTFDDGLADHARHVAPILAERGWSGVFFASAGAVLGGRMLVVHRIHHLLAGAYADPRPLVRELKAAIHERSGPGMPAVDELVKQWWRPNRFDPPEINFIKRTLQRGLPITVAEEVTAHLFARRVSADEADFARTFYLGEADLRYLVDMGMDVGGHGVDHAWLDSLTPAEQEIHVRGSIAMIRRAYGALPDAWSFAYPYGGYDATTLELLERYGCRLAFTVETGLADASTPRLEVPRLDTKDLPFHADAEVSEWTIAASLAPA